MTDVYVFDGVKLYTLLKLDEKAKKIHLDDKGSEKIYNLKSGAFWKVPGKKLDEVKQAILTRDAANRLLIKIMEDLEVF